MLKLVIISEELIKKAQITTSTNIKTVITIANKVFVLKFNFLIGLFIVFTFPNSWVNEIIYQISN